MQRGIPTEDDRRAGPPGDTTVVDAIDGTEVIAFADAAAWEEWLDRHHGDAADVWLRIAKKGSAATSVTIGEALEVALCFGWIDSHRRALDGDHYLQRYSPRRPRSPWSRINVAHAERLVAEGRMRDAGLDAIRAARADGRWEGRTGGAAAGQREARKASARRVRSAAASAS